MIAIVRKALQSIIDESHNFENISDEMSYVTHEMIRLLSLMIGSSSKDKETLDIAILIISKQLKEFSNEIFNGEIDRLIREKEVGDKTVH